MYVESVLVKSYLQFHFCYLFFVYIVNFSLFSDQMIIYYQKARTYVMYVIEFTHLLHIYVK